jgi:hypothetical protein
MALEGKRSYLITLPDIVEVYIGAPLWNKTGTDTFKIPYIETGSGGIDLELLVTKGPSGDDMGYGQGMNKVDMTFKSPWTHFAMLQNIVKLAIGSSAAGAKDLAGFVNMYCQNANGEFFTFFSNTDLQDWVGAPACTSALSLDGTHFHIGKDARFIEWHFHGFMTDAQLQFLQTSTSAYVTAGTGLTGGSTLTLNTISTSRANVYNYYLHTMKIGGTDFGVPDEITFDFTIIGDSDNELQYNRHRTLHGEVQLMGRTPQASLTQIAANSTLSLTDAALVAITMGGETLTLNNTRTKPKTHTMGRNKAFVEVDYKGKLPLANIDFTTLAQPVFTMNPA